MGTVTAAIIAAAAFRLRGDSWLRTVWPGWWGTPLGRALYAVAVAVAAVALAGGPGSLLQSVALAVALAVALFLGAIPGWPASLDMGTAGQSLARDLAAHSLRGIGWTLPAGLAIAAAGYVLPGGWLWAGLAYALSGAAAGPLYWLAGLVPWRLRAGRVWLSRQDARGVNVELGEVLFGAWIGGGLYIALEIAG